MKVLITGASRGIGKELVNYYLNKADKIYAIARKPNFDNPKIENIPLDLADIESVREFSKNFKDKVDIVILNAGVSIGHSKSWIRYEEFEWLFKINFLSLHALLEDIVPQMDSGKIVFISSLASIVASPTSAAYSASKRAINSYADSLRRLYPNLDVINILPGFIDTDMTRKNDFSMPFFMSLEEGVSEIIKAIEKNKPFYAFPKRFYYLLKIFNLLPIKIQDKLLQKLIK
jgi:short-subunit dehydrogenase